MNGSDAPPTTRLEHLAALELAVCCGVAQRVCHRLALAIFRAASAVGDWPLSVVVGLMLLITHGWRTIAGWAVISIAGVTAQKILKHRYQRLRPCERLAGPPQRVRIPDRGSFPSGHTLHAVMAAVVAATLVPAVAPGFLVIAVVIALSRVVLGMHYPSDVAAGAALGSVLAACLLAAL